jgi:hypothetical protein
MRWQQLFADLQGQFEAAEAATEFAESASRARLEAGAVRLGDRMRGSLGGALTLRCQGAGQVAGVLTDVGVDWLLLEDEAGRELLASRRALVSVSGLGRLTAAPEPELAVRGRLDLRWALRALARDRAAVQIVLVDGAFVVGTIDRVGVDFVEVAEHAVEEPRRQKAVRGVQAVVIDGVAVVRTLLPGRA